MTTLNIVLAGTYYPKHARKGGPGQIFSLLVDVYIKMRHMIKALKINIINTCFPLELYMVVKDNIVKYTGLKAAFLTIPVIARSKVVCICGISIMGLIVFLLAKLMMKKTCYYLHGIELIEYKYEEKSLMKSLIYIAIELLTLKIASAIIYVSKFYEKLTYSIYKHVKAKSFVAYNGLDKENLDCAFRFSKEILPLPEKYILYVGRPTKCKGFHIALRLSNIILKLFPNLYLIIVVSNKKKAQNLIAKCIKCTEVKKRIILIDVVNKEILRVLYRNAICTLIPSLFESFNMVALESLACNTPILISKNCGVLEILPKTKDCTYILNEILSNIDKLTKVFCKLQLCRSCNCSQLVKNAIITKTFIKLLKIFFSVIKQK